MIRGMYSAISGLRTHQTMLDVVSNNLANVNTVGYKASRVTFKDQLQQTLYGGSAEGPNTGGTNSAQVGLGVQLGSIDAVMGDGSLQSTGNPLDVAIQGDGFFRVGIGDPSTTPATMPTEMNYTRAGNFIRND
jgi:flagellar hook protein FlgE